jgi:hypothetical protein
MNDRARTIMAVLAVPVLAVIVFAVYGYVQHYAAVFFFPRIVPRPYTEMIACAVLGAIAAGAVVGYPLALLFRKAIFYAAVASAVPVLLLRVPEIIEYWNKDQVVVYMSSLESVVLLAALVGGAWLARKQLRSNSAMYSDTYSAPLRAPSSARNRER